MGCVLGHATLKTDTIDALPKKIDDQHGWHPVVNNIRRKAPSAVVAAAAAPDLLNSLRENLIVWQWRRIGR